MRGQVLTGHSAQVGMVELGLPNTSAAELRVPPSWLLPGAPLQPRQPGGDELVMPCEHFHPDPSGLASRPLRGPGLCDADKQDGFPVRRPSSCIPASRVQTARRTCARGEDAGGGLVQLEYA